jgi:ribosome-interacting GTPase 1
LGLLKAKLAKYRSQLLEPSKKAGEKGEGFDVLKSGDARVALIGFPSVGKVWDQVENSFEFLFNTFPFFNSLPFFQL